MKGRIVTIALVSAAMIVLCITAAWAFPDKEIAGIIGGPPFNFGFTDNATSFVLKKNRMLLETYGEKLAVVDLAFYYLPDPQPYDILADSFEENNSPFLDAVYLSATDEVLVVQERGHALLYSLASPDSEPFDITIAEGKSLATIVVNNAQTRAYIGNNTDGTIHELNLSTLAVDATVTVTIPLQPNFKFTGSVYVNATNKAFFSTDSGAIVVLPDQGTAATIIDVDTTNGNILSAIDVTPSGAFVYATDRSRNELVKIDASSLGILTRIDLTPNTSPVDVAAVAVTRPNATYIYVAGGNGVSVVDMNSNVVLDLGDGSGNHEPIPTTAAPKMLVGSGDGYVYMSLSTTAVGIISENPWISIADIVYSGGGSSLGGGETVTITFVSSEDGTYELRVGGDVDRSGTLLTDIGGNTSGTAIADADVSAEIPYDANSAHFAEGDNDIFVFVTDADGNVGRHAAIVTVDTPPDVVTIRSTGFGRERVYVNFDRLTADDMDHYNVYVDPDPDAVLTKADVGAVVSQPDGGTTVSGSVGSLVNGTLYFIAVEGVDAAGNVSPARAATLPSGARASATPQETVGPAAFSGEEGCRLSARGNGAFSSTGMYFVIVAIIILALWRRVRGLKPMVHAAGKKGAGLIVQRIAATLGAAAIILVSLPHNAHAREPSSQWWSFEVKSGFWMPTASKTTKFFDSCCNIWTRVQGGVLIHGRYGIEESVGIMYQTGSALGMNTGEVSQDSFGLLLIPFETNFAWRLDYWDWRYIIPYVKVGIDYVYFRESVAGDVTQGVKWGTHGVGGLQIPLAHLSDDVAQLDQIYGLNDISFVVEAQYGWINDFGGRGLDLSGWLFSAGFLFSF